MLEKAASFNRTPVNLKEEENVEEGKQPALIELDPSRKEMPVTRESFWENDFSLPDELHYKPFEAGDDKSASTVLLANQKQCSSSTLFGPKRPISRLIGSSDANSNDLQPRFALPNSTNGSTRNKILAASLNFGKPGQGSSLVSQLASARPYI